MRTKSVEIAPGLVGLLRNDESPKPIYLIEGDRVDGVVMHPGYWFSILEELVRLRSAIDSDLRDAIDGVVGSPIRSGVRPGKSSIRVGSQADFSLAVFAAYTRWH